MEVKAAKVCCYYRINCILYIFFFRCSMLLICASVFGILIQLGMTELIFAAFRGNPETILQLLQQPGVDINAQDKVSFIVVVVVVIVSVWY